MTWEKLQPLADAQIHIGCLNCSTAARVAPLNMRIEVGFGAAFATKDGELVYEEQQGVPSLTVADIERLAVDDPDHDWRIAKHGPMHGETYQRQGSGNWVCIESNDGFA
jgi:hypothetical protein